MGKEFFLTSPMSIQKDDGGKHILINPNRFKLLFSKVIKDL